MIKSFKGQPPDHTQTTNSLLRKIALPKIIFIEMKLIRYSSPRSVVDSLSHLYDRKYQKSIEVVDLFRFVAETPKGLV